MYSVLYAHFQTESSDFPKYNKLFSIAPGLRIVCGVQRKLSDQMLPGDAVQCSRYGKGR